MWNLLPIVGMRFPISMKLNLGKSTNHLLITFMKSNLAKI